MDPALALELQFAAVAKMQPAQPADQLPGKAASGLSTLLDENDACYLFPDFKVIHIPTHIG